MKLISILDTMKDYHKLILAGKKGTGGVHLVLFFDVYALHIVSIWLGVNLYLTAMVSQKVIKEKPSKIESFIALKISSGIWDTPFIIQ